MSTRTTIMGLALMIGMILSDITRLQALSVGDIVVQSRRGEPFLAEVPLKLAPMDQQRGVVVMLGNRKEYRSEEVARPEVIDHLKAIWQTGARDLIRLTSKVPVQMPAFEIVLLVQSGPITIVKTYRVTLPTAPQPPRVAASPAAQPASITPGSRPAPTASRTPPLPAWLQRLPKRYGAIKRGETLHSIVLALGPPKSKVWPTVVRIWQANKERFLGGNLHGLRPGSYLTMPTDLARTLPSLNQRQALKIVAEQWEIWQALRRAASGRQRIVLPTSQKPAVVTEKPVVSPPKPEPVAEAAPQSDAKPASPLSVVVLTAGPVDETPTVTDLRSTFQGLNKLVTQQLSEPVQVGTRTDFVRAAELQMALQGLEERLSQRLDSMQQVQTLQQALQIARQAPVTQKTLLDQFSLTNPMSVVLMVETALLILLAGGLLWRWVIRRHARAPGVV